MRICRICILHYVIPVTPQKDDGWRREALEAYGSEDQTYTVVNNKRLSQTR